MGNLTTLNYGQYIRKTPLFILLLLLFAGDCMAMPVDDRKTVDSIIKLANSQRDSSIEGAERMYYRALNIAKGVNYNYGATKSLIGLGMCYINSSQKDKALNCGHMALQYCGNDVKGHEQRVLVYIMLSQTYYYKGKYDSSAWYRYAALGELESNRLMDPKMQMKVYCSILDFWLNVHDDIRNDLHIQQVMQHINSLVNRAVEKKDTASLMYLYFYKAGYYNNIQQNDSARYYCQTSLKMGHLTNMTNSMRAGLLINISLTYIDDKNPEMALLTIQKAKDLFVQGNDYFVRQQLLTDLLTGEAYCIQHKYDKAIAAIIPALNGANNRHLVHILVTRTYRTLGDCYYAIGEYKKAAQCRKTYVELRDTMMKVEKLELVYNLEMKYRIADKNKELAQKQLAITRNESRLKTKNFLIIGISAGLALLSLVSLLLYRNSLHKQKLQKEKYRNLRQEMQINSLQAMIAGEEKERSRIARDLHDGMGGTLGTIRTQLSAIFRKHTTTNVTSDFLDVLLLLEEASTELRKTAHNLMPEILLQEGLAKATALFCERVRKGHTLEINFETWGKAPALEADFELAVYRIIQELVHNILKHAAARTAIVQIVYHERQLCITVEDDGNGMLLLTAQQAEGMGLKTIRERMHSLNGDLHIESVPGQGTSIHIEFTFKQNTSRYVFKTSNC
ncbi:Histidine kinase-, DNA gyrase B-, and HSP90-like ATPase [Chitinophaga sp. CF118]|uniref:ATP-binding protein n=1 Tax=Chitinophaga sp. CF118 TaxID=1884367 RepID=UPI0008E08BA6|nr:sensor histidine kinase [Chitinophaga sp. CF118]SFE96965.1 Histidine kinase-, DNA gyrase B-, and HSP90-like ATPase [Chitinophaga sp. CF118]